MIEIYLNKDSPPIHKASKDKDKNLRLIWLERKKLTLNFFMKIVEVPRVYSVKLTTRFGRFYRKYSIDRMQVKK